MELSASSLADHGYVLVGAADASSVSPLADGYRLQSRADRGYALCWYDPVTRVGLVEPMRTEDDHQRRGLARHLLTSGLRRLVDLEAERIRISWEADNPASSALYPDVGFVPTQRMRTYAPEC
jgi:GNAT superfamily N-acetyltransferase